MSKSTVCLYLVPPLCGEPGNLHPAQFQTRSLPSLPGGTADVTTQRALLDDALHVRGQRAVPLNSVYRCSCCCPFVRRTLPGGVICVLLARSTAEWPFARTSLLRKAAFWMWYGPASNDFARPFSESCNGVRNVRAFGPCLVTGSSFHHHVWQRQLNASGR